MKYFKGQQLKYLHIMQNEKFIAPFIEFIRENFDFDEHFFIIIGGLPESKHPIPAYKNVMVLDRNLTQKKHLLKYSSILKPYFEKAEKAIIHGLFIDNIVDFFFINRKFARKSYWVIWGGDLYGYLNRNRSLSKWLYEYRKKTVVKEFAGFLTNVDGDAELAKEWFGSTKGFYECIFYPSNFYKELDVKPKKSDTIYIQVGNSADPGNYHLEVFEKLRIFKNRDIEIIVPLSYGNKEYADKVIQKGKRIFGNKFNPLTEFLPFEKYLEILGQIDIAIFNHNRQQAQGNIITLLGLGKKVFLRPGTTHYDKYKSLGITVYSIEELNVDKIDKAVAEKNIEIVKEYYSKENAKKQLEKFFNS